MNKLFVYSLLQVQSFLIYTSLEIPKYEEERGKGEEQEGKRKEKEEEEEKKKERKLFSKQLKKKSF